MGAEDTAKRRNKRSGQGPEQAEGIVHNDFRGAQFTNSQVQGSGISVSEVRESAAKKPAGAASRRAYFFGGATVAVAAVTAVTVTLLWPGSHQDKDVGARDVGSSASVHPPPSASTSSRQEPVPNSPVNPVHVPLDRASVNRVFQIYMDGLTNHDMAAFRSGTCPRLRYTLLGFVLNGYAVGRWQLLPYEIPSAADQVTVQARITQQDPGTGALAGDVTYRWIVERDADQNYWVCGWLG